MYNLFACKSSIVDSLDLATTPPWLPALFATRLRQEHSTTKLLQSFQKLADLDNKEYTSLYSERMAADGLRKESVVVKEEDQEQILNVVSKK